jgi:DNA-binding MarR family transcriptional regulator
VSRHYEAHVSPTGLRNTQYALLSHVVRLGPLRLGDLARAMEMDASTLTRNLQHLLDQGLVESHVGADARSRIVQATATGVALRHEAQQAWKRAQRALNARLGDARVATLHTLIDDCMQALAATGADDV